MKRNPIHLFFYQAGVRLQIHRILLTFAACLLTQVLFAQVNGNKKKGTITTEYDRVSITPFLIEVKDQRIATIFNQYKISDKYFDHSLSYNQIKPFDADSVKIAGGSKISHDIIEKWYSRDSEHFFSMKLFEDRGLYNATDDMVLLDRASKVSRLKDLGERLIKKSYVLVYNFYAIEKINRENEKENERVEGYKVKLKASIYKIDWNDSVASVFYNNLWLEKNDPDAVNKITAFDNTKFPMIAVKTLYLENSSTEVTKKSKTINDAEVFTNAVSPLMEKVYFEAEREIEDFKVKTALWNSKPLQAKIGLKEGVRVDQRYFVYEIALDKDNNRTGRRKGVVRATKKIADNRTISTGQSPTSTFYQVGGRKLRQGMVLKQQNDLGIGVSLGYGSFSSSVSQNFIHLGLDYNFSALVGRNIPTGIHLFVSGNFGISEYDYFKTVNGALNSNYTDIDFEADSIKKELKAVNADFNFGLSKDYYFARNFCFTPFLSYQYGLVSLSGKKYLVETASPYYIKKVDPSAEAYKEDKLAKNKGMNAGARLYINIVHNFKLYFSGSYTVKLNTKVGESYAAFILPEEIRKSKSGSYLSCGFRYSW